MVSFLKNSINKIESVQRRFIKQLLGFQNISNDDCLTNLGIKRLEQ